MRIIAGTLGGRIFAAPHGHRTHPMSDKMRGALFNVLMDLEGQMVLDAFAGSGALAFEALSRGAAGAVLLEQDRNAQRTIAENIITLDLQSRAKLIRANANAWLRTADDTFDLILLDPPYDALLPDLLERLADRLNTGGVAVVSWPGKQSAPELQGLEQYSAKHYGDGSLYFFRRAG